ncbi:MAG: hypothetical protein NC081_00120 [Roseburia sp.]|nr:hypothetical protein [Roseburia sp.]
MFGILQEEKWISLIMFVLLGFSVFMRLLLGFLYSSMIKESDNMAATENKLLRQCKLKFANCYQLSGGVSNIPIFVDKFIQRLSLGPFSFEGIYHFSGQAMLLSVVASGVGICKSIVQGKTLGDVLPFYIVSFIGLYLYFSVSSAVDIKSRKQILKVNLVDYLENHLSARMDITTENMVMLYGEDALLYGEEPISYAKRRRNRGNARDKMVSGRGKRTVELMPIGGKLSITESRNKAAAAETTNDASGSILMEADKLPPLAAAETARGANPDDSKISKEELEALLEEFLAI